MSKNFSGMKLSRIAFWGGGNFKNLELIWLYIPKIYIPGRKINQEDLILRRVDYGESRGAIDCMKIVGSKLYLSFDDFSSIAIQDFW